MDDFDEHNANILDSDLEKLTESESTEEGEEESNSLDSQAPLDQEDTASTKLTRKRSSFDPEKNARTVFIGNIALTTTKKVCVIHCTFECSYSTISLS